MDGWTASVFFGMACFWCYCWWKKSCTTCYLWNPVKNGEILPYQNQLFTPNSVHQTVFKQNPAPPNMMILPLFIGFWIIPGGDRRICCYHRPSMSVSGIFSPPEHRQVSALLYPGIHRLTWRSWGNLVKFVPVCWRRVFYKDTEHIHGWCRKKLSKKYV